MNRKGLTITTLFIAAIAVVALSLAGVLIYSYSSGTIIPDDTNTTEPNTTGTPIDPLGDSPQNQTHLACINRRCAVVQGAGSNLNGCTTVNAACGSVGSGGGGGGSGGSGSGSSGSGTGPSNQPPIAVFEAIPSSGVAALFVFFNASNSSDPDGTISNYEWNFGDATNGTGVTANHTYTVANNYTVSLTVTDNGGASTSTSSTIIVGSPLDTTAPQYTIVTPTPTSPTAYAPSKSYNFSSTWTDNVGIAHVDLIFNGTLYTTTNIGSLYTRQLTDLPAGTYSYFFRGYDAANNMNQTQTFTYTVNKAAPILNVNVNPSTVQPNVTATTTVSGCPAQITCALTLDGSAITPPHTISYPNAGVHTYNYSTSGNTNYSATSVSATLTVTSSPTFTLIVTKQSTNGGNGTVTSNVSGINCGASCNASYVSGTNVQLTATPVAGSSFTGWSGNNCTGTGSCVVSMNSNRTVIAIFALAPPNVPLNLQATVISPTQIDLIWTDTSTNEAGFFLDRATNNAFSQNLQTFSIAANQQSFSSTNLTAATTYFYRIRATNAAGNSSNSNTASATTSQNTFTLTVTKNGQGTVTSNPSGINCGATCQSSFSQGAIVTLTPAPTAGWLFSSWSGACSGNGTCQVTMNNNQAVTATFVQQQQNFLLTVTKTGSGSGTVTSSPSGINCGSTCSASYLQNTQVNLTANPSAGSTFIGWSGACSGSGACQLVMSQARDVTATFNTPGGTNHCSDGIDNDGDGLRDWQYDLGCSGPEDDNEGAEPLNQEDGWTTFNLASDARVILVANSIGSEETTLCNAITAAGRSCQTATSVSAGMNLLRNGFPDWMLLKRGNTWNEGIFWNSKSGRSITEPMVVSSYGSSTSRPTVTSSSSTSGTFSYGALVGINFDGSGSENGLNINHGGDYFLSEDNRMQDFLSATIIEVLTGNGKYRTIRRNVMTNLGGTIIFIGKSNHTLVEENVLYRTNAVGLHSMYIAAADGQNTNVTVRGNLVYYNSNANAGNGIMVRPGGVIEDNFITAMGWSGITVGQCSDHPPCGSPTDLGQVPMKIRNNVVMRSNSNAVSGDAIQTNWRNQPGTVISGNIVAHGAAGCSSCSDRAISIGYPLTSSANITNNIAYNYGVIALNGGPATIYLKDNQVQNNLIPVDFHLLFTTDDLSAMSDLRVQDNRWYNGAPGASNTWWAWPLMTFSQWQGATGETGSVVNLQSQYIDPSRTPGTYHVSLGGGTNSYEAFFDRAIQNSRLNWNEAYTAHALNEYVRDGFTIPGDSEPGRIQSPPEIVANSPNEAEQFLTKVRDKVRRTLRIEVVTTAATSETGIISQVISSSDVNVSDQKLFLGIISLLVIAIAFVILTFSQRKN